MSIGRKLVSLLVPARLKVYVRRTRAHQTLLHWRNLLCQPGYRKKDRADRAQFDAFCAANGEAMRENLLPRNGKRRLAVIVRNHNLGYAGIQAFVMKVLQLAGFETVVVGRRDFSVLRYDWLVGARSGYTFADFGYEYDPEWVEDQIRNLTSLQDWLALKYKGVAVGRIVLSTVLRQLKVGHLDYQAPEVQARLRDGLAGCVRDTLSAGRLLRDLQPDCVVFVDRGYAGQGELFDLAVNCGIDALTWDVGYKSDRMIFKRYNAANRREHQLSPSIESWKQLRSMEWKPEYGDIIRREIFRCYESQEWFSAVGTQFGKQMLSGEKTRAQLNLSADRKVAVIFPHILWDGSFFFGEDLFNDYEEWLIETVKAACANTRVQWVIKLHPSHLVKSRVENDPSKPAEVQLMDRLFSKLPDHVQLVYPDTNLSTYSLFQIADYTVTVRGTVGIESAVLGIPTLTAGTGRYDRRGFTVDSSSREEYLQKLACIETIPRLTAQQCQLAELYAFAVFLCRPFPLTSARIWFERDERATARFSASCRTREEWLAAPDFHRLTAWLQDGTLEDLLTLPQESTGFQAAGVQSSGDGTLPLTRAQTA